VKLEEQNEERRLQELGEAGRRLQSAESLLAASRARAAADQRRRAAAADWQLAELAHGRALSDVRAAEQAAATAAAASSTSRDRYVAAYTRAESLRRVAATRAQEILDSRENAERKELDELGTLRHGRQEDAA